MAGRPRAIDCDVHCDVPSPEALTPYLSEYWQEYLAVGRFGPTAIGHTYPPWLPMLAGRGASTAEQLEETVLARADLAILNCYYAVEALTHPDLSAALATAVNSWLAAEWLDRDERLRGSAIVVPEYPDTAVAEVERIAADGRFVQVVVPARAPSGYGHRRYWPIWEAVARHELVLGITYGGVTHVAPTSSGWVANHYESYVAAIMAFESQLLSLIMQGTFDRIPALRVAILESGWTWCPSLMWRMDQWWKALQREVPWVRTPPSSYVRRHVRFTTEPSDAPVGSAALRHAVEHLGGAGMLMHGSDHPHDYGDSAGSVFAVLSADEADAVRWSTAADWYRLEVQRST